MSLEFINPIRLVSTGWTPVKAEKPTLVLPLEVPGGYLMPVPARGTTLSTPAASEPLTLKGWIGAGGYSCLLNPGMYQIWYSGGSDIWAGVYQADTFEPLKKVDCGDGAYAVPSHSIATVGTSSGVARAANPFCTYRLFQNISSNEITLELGETAVANEGIVLYPKGSYEMSKKNGNLYKGAVNAIATAASSDLIVLEGGVPIIT